MADNIKIVGNIVNIQTLSRYNDNDLNLIPFQKIQDYFGENGDYIEFFIYDIDNNLLNVNYNYLSYKLPSSNNLKPLSNSFTNNTSNKFETNNVISNTTSTGSLFPVIEIDPISDLQNLGYSSGEFNIRYNFFKNKISTPSEKSLFIREISSDRTEIRLASTSLSNTEIEEAFNLILNEINNSTYYSGYLLNFGNNEQYLAINIALNKSENGYEILFKLYQPLPLNIDLKSTLWVVEEKTTPYIFSIDLDKLIILAKPLQLKGPNFNIPINNQGNVTSQYSTYNSLISELQSIHNSSYQQLLNKITSQSIDINVNYTEYSNFVFFGSSYQRLYNFYNKVKEIEDYNNLIYSYTPLTSSTPNLILEINQYSSSIDNIISNFDGYESYLYFESSSYSWPKSGSIKPYSLLPTSSMSASNWYNNATSSTKDYDANNYTNLEFSIPLFIKDNQDNQPFLQFLNMVGHYFDNIWVYLNSITDINLANNNLEEGISKDIVYERLKSLGIRLYNTQAGESINQYLIGSNTGSNVFNYDFSSTGSYLNNVSRKDLTSELYKRIYHNLPLLIKTKGTVSGLENLITIFGITGSILNVKEFGGNVKQNTLSGYNSDKVRIIPNSITGSVLSSEISLQTYPQDYSKFRNEDTHYVDISFSPETQIDSYISSSISSTNPTWSLDNYIGDPSQQFSSSYIDLNNQRKLYFENGTPGYPGFTGSLMDYNGFIRLIQYFDNSLFKMLEDFIPERSSLSTGITFSSPVLERNKIVYAIPQFTTQSVYEAEFERNIYVSSSYDKIYNDLQGNKKPYFTGEFEGTNVNVNQYFLDNYNIYLQPTSSLTSLDINKFNHSDWNVLLNNVSQSVLSTVRNKIEYIYGTTSSIISRAELQDSNLSLQSYVNSRYNGSKVESALYNTWTIGDNSYGKNPSIDHNTHKLGIFTQIETSSFLPGRNPVSIKYLVDRFGNLTELNQRNKHWHEIQNTFVAGDTLNVSLFDNKKYNNQKQSDGDKLIFDSGYTYSPLLYFTGSCTGQTLSFLNLEGANSYYSRANNNLLILNQYITGSTSLGFPFFSGSYVSNLFNNVTQGSQYFMSGSANSFPSYSIQETADHRFNVSCSLTVEFNGVSTPVSSSWYFEVWESGSLGTTLISSQSHTFLTYTGDPGDPDLNLSTSTYTFTNSSSSISLIEGDRLIFKLKMSGSNTTNYTASLSQGDIIVSSLAASTGYATTPCPFLSTTGIQTGSNDEIVFSQGVSTFYDNGYVFSPNPLSGSINNLYPTYGDVDYEFVTKPYDIILIHLSDGTYLEARILRVYKDTNNLIRLKLDQQLSQFVKDDLTNSGGHVFLRFLLLSRIEDETNAYIVYSKRPGQTSYGFIIPSDISSDVLSNIDIITKEVKQKLLADQQGIT